MEFVSSVSNSISPTGECALIEGDFALDPALIRKLESYLPVLSDRVLCAIHRALSRRRTIVISLGYGRVTISKRGKARISPGGKHRDKRHARKKSPYNRKLAAEW